MTNGFKCANEFRNGSRRNDEQEIEEQEMFEEIDLTAQEELEEEDQPIIFEYTDAELREREEEQVQSRGSELAADLSSMFADERTGDTEYYLEGGFSCEVCHCWSRSTCGRESSSTHHSLFGREITNSSSDVLGLRCIETWRLPCDQVSEEGIRLRYEGGQGSGDLWDRPEHLLRVEDVKIRDCCELNHCWIYRGEHSFESSWFFSHESDEDNRVQIICYQCVQG